ncbi:MAG TPA: hypothetical protein ENN69_08340 [Spirochaetia bacterium]|nr:hypothetical protein [Spirochaetia bacterium]
MSASTYTALDLRHAYAANKIPAEGGYFVTRPPQESTDPFQLQIISCGSIRSIDVDQKGAVLRAEGERLTLFLPPGAPAVRPTIRGDRLCSDGEPILTLNAPEPEFCFFFRRSEKTAQVMEHFLMHTFSDEAGLSEEESHALTRTIILKIALREEHRAYE